MTALLNIDLGERDDEPAELFALAQIANVACGGHAGDAASVDRAVERCQMGGTKLSAHPSYPDREGFGRRALQLDARVLRASVAEQCDLLADRASKAAALVTFVKPHGALYHAAHRDPGTAVALVAGAVESLGYEITLIGPSGGALADAARQAGIRFWVEGFADRAVRSDGTLVPRAEPGAIITEVMTAAAVARGLRTAVDTICVHGDTPGAVEIARAVRRVLDEVL